MLLNMTIANFKSVKSEQTISFQGVKDSRLSPSKVIEINENLKVIKTSAIIGPNGAGKSTFIRALETLKNIIMAPDELQNPLNRAFATSTFKYGGGRKKPASIQIEVLLENGDGTEENPVVIARFKLVADKDRIYEESLQYIINNSRKLMYERLYKGEEEGGGYSYRFGKLYRGEKKRQAAKLTENRTFLAGAAKKGGLTALELYTWFEKKLNLLPNGTTTASEQSVIKLLKAHPGWSDQLEKFLWALDITDIGGVSTVVDKSGKENLRYKHLYNEQEAYLEIFVRESLSLRRLTAVAFAFFEAFITEKVIVIDDFGQLLHPDVLCHLIEIFETCDKQSQLLVVDCNPSLLRDGLLRRDAVWFAQKDKESSTEFYSLSEFKGARGKSSTSNRYMQGAFGALPIESEFYFVHDGTPVEAEEEKTEEEVK